MPSKEQQRAYDALKKRYKSAVQREKRAKRKVEILCGQVDMARIHPTVGSGATHNKQLTELREDVDELVRLTAKGAADLVGMSAALERESHQSESLQNRLKSMHRTCEALRKKIARTQLRKGKGDTLNHIADSMQLPSSHYLKDESGVIQPEIRDMLRRLTCQGVATERVSEVVKIVADGLGIEVADSVSARSVARIMLEGLVQASMQVAHELDQAKYFTISGDGTSIKNQQHEVKLISVQLPPASNDLASQQATQLSSLPVVQTLGVHKSISHTAQQQLSGWIRAIDACCDVYKRSPLGQNQPISSKLVAPKLRGALTDHAADQKRFHELLRNWKQNCDRETRAVSSLKKMSVAEQLYALSNYLDNAADTIGDWRALPEGQQNAIMHDAWLALASELGFTEFQKLTPSAQFDVDFLAWMGCCMHKELNAVKCGVPTMNKAWESSGLKGPLALWNQYEGKSPPQQPKSQPNRGAIKLTSLAGALFRHKDEKRGYQQTVDQYFESTFGYSNRFPDTSNTRYGSYFDAAAELFLHQEMYLELLDTTRLSKGSRKFTNIESNVFKGLKDVPTLTELAVLALYAQAVGHPYMRQARNVASNALDLGSLHTAVKRYCKSVILDPDLLLRSDMSSGVGGTFDGTMWDRPEVIYRVLSQAPELPNLRLALVAFFEGALETWERFTTEFEGGGIIARATAEQRQSAWMTPKNDISEGALGQCRQMLRRAPTMTDEQRDACAMWKRNKTYEWAKETLTPEDRNFVIQEARDKDSSGTSKKVRSELNAALKAQAKSNRERQRKALQRKSANEERLADTELLTEATYEQLSVMNLTEINRQIDKLCQVGGDQAIRARSTIGNKKAKIEALLAGLDYIKSILPIDKKLKKITLLRRRREVRKTRTCILTTKSYNSFWLFKK